MRWILTFVCACLFASVATAGAGLDHSSMQNELSAYGVSETIDWSVKPRKIEIYVDRQQAIASIPDMQQVGLLNPDLTQTAINLYPNAILITAATEIAIMETIDAYSNSSVDDAKIFVWLMAPDDYGHKQKQSLFSYRFNRALYNRIDWDNFATQNLYKIAPGFRYSDWAMQNMESVDQ